MVKLARNRSAAEASARSAKEIVPGSMPTTAQATGDIGLIAAQKGLPRLPFAERHVEQNAARLSYLRHLDATDAKIDQLVKTRDVATAPLRERAFQSVTPVDYDRVENVINTLRKSTAGGRQETGRGLDILYVWLKERKEQGRNSPADAYALHQDINDLIRGRINDDKGAVRLSAGLATTVKKELADVIEDAAPGFKRYLERYSRLSRPIEKMEALRDSLGSNLERVTNATPSGSEYTLSQAKMRNANQALSDVGIGKKRRDVLGNVQADLNRAVNAEQAVRTPGSDTAQNLASANLVNNVLGERLGGSRFAQSLIERPLAFAYKPAERQIQEKLLAGLLDPSLGADMLRSGRGKRQAMTIEEILSEAIAPRLYGGLLGY
jgi:hypothetical protein